ncbi:MAG: hypothetical protein J6T74_07640 [Clostridia bacterium]|nr:hypothetical protein [Clostridia bacterium]
MNNELYKIQDINIFYGRKSDGTLSVIPFVYNVTKIRIKRLDNNQICDLDDSVFSGFEGYKDFRITKFLKRVSNLVTIDEKDGPIEFGFYYVEIKSKDSHKGFPLCSSQKLYIKKDKLLKFTDKIERFYTGYFKKNPLDCFNKQVVSTYKDF